MQHHRASALEKSPVICKKHDGIRFTTCMTDWRNAFNTSTLLKKCVRPPLQSIQKQPRGGCGHSCQETPGLIPNPAVKLTHVVCCTEVRESPGTIPGCNHRSFLHGRSSRYHRIFIDERQRFSCHSIVFPDTGKDPRPRMTFI